MSQRAPDFLGPAPAYRPAWWLPGGHLQTIGSSFAPRPVVAYRRERLVAPDGDDWDFDWVDARANHAGAAAPLLVLFHGLEGGSGSHYARSVMDFASSLGWRGVIPHFRGCGGELNRRPRAYHSGDHEEVGAMLGAIRARIDAGTPVHAVGVSLGGSALVNWLGRAGADARGVLDSAAAVSTPLDLTAAGIAIGQGLNRIYTRYFLSTLVPKGIAMARRFPGTLDEPAIRRVRSMHDFDDCVTAPLHGFAGADDYWRRASAKPWLAAVAIPTLVLNARNDPFIPAESLPRGDAVSRSVLLEQPENGGHAGFVAGPFPGNHGWLPRRLLDFFLRGR